MFDSAEGGVPTKSAVFLCQTGDSQLWRVDGHQEVFELFTRAWTIDQLLVAGRTKAAVAQTILEQGGPGGNIICNKIPDFLAECKLVGKNGHGFTW